MKSLFDKNTAKKPNYKAEPYIKFVTFAVLFFWIWLAVYIFDALRNFAIRARAEPFIALAALATIIYAIFAYRQWQTMNEQLGEMRSSSSQTEQTIGALREQAGTMKGQLDEMRSERRPWVRVDPFVGSITWDQQGANVAMRYETKNTGRSPAMHVYLQDAILTTMVSDPRDSPYVRIKTMSGKMKSEQFSIGYPLFPEQTETHTHTLLFSREEVRKFIQFMKTFPDLQSETPKDIPLVTAYVVDYGFEIGQTHHQTFCLGDLYRINQDRPLGPGLAVPIDEDLPASRLKLETGFISCEAD